jgi:hypothetical protein
VSIVNQIFIQRDTYEYWQLTLKKSAEIGFGAIVTTLSLAIASPTVFASPNVNSRMNHQLIAGETNIIHSPVLLAAADPMFMVSDNFNPGLQLPPPKTEFSPPEPEPPKPKPPKLEPPKSEPPKPKPPKPEPSSAKGSILILESLTPNFQNIRNESGQINQTVETTASFSLENGNWIKVRSGFNTFIKPGFSPVNNTPIDLSWETKIDTVKIESSIGLNLFDRLPTSPTFGLKVAVPITPGITLSGAIEQGAYKFNTETIQNQVSALRFGPGLLWQIDRDTSLVANYKYGIYSDSNTENQLFSRLEHKSGQFWIAANLFTWGYEKNIGAASGYFTPQDFLAYSGEIGIEGNIFFDSLSCKLSTQLGNQQASGASTIGQAYQALCKTKISPSLEANFGYATGNSRKDFSSQETGNTQTITGGLIYKF